MTRSVGFLLTALSMAAFAQDRAVPPVPPSGSVSLPLSEYNHLLELAGQPRIVEEQPPVAHSIKRAELKLDVRGETASGSIQLDGEIYAKGPQRIQLVSGWTVFDARLKGRELPLQQSSGIVMAILPGPAPFLIALDAGLPVTIEPGRATLKIPVPPAGITQLSLSVPGEQSGVMLSGGIITSRTASGGRTNIEAALTPGVQASVWWTSRDVVLPAQAPRDVRFLSDVKTLVTVSETEIGLEALADLTIVQGEASEFQFVVPDGFEVTAVSGSSLQTRSGNAGVVTLSVLRPEQRNHQFLISMERSGDAAKAALPPPGFKGAQRETGEMLVETDGPIEVAASETGGLKRIDVKEASPNLRALARHAVQSAYRVQRQPGATPALALEWVRFPTGTLLSAVAQEAVATTMVTSEGRSLTEVKLVLKNQSQPFLKVALPPGASILSADVEGEPVKPVVGADGSRVPLLRAGFHPSGAYNASFVFVHSGTPFTKKGESQLALPKMDLPVEFLQWEVFLPDQYKVKDFGGDVVLASLLPPPGPDALEEAESALSAAVPDARVSLRGAQVGGIVVDPTGAVIPRVAISVTHLATNRTQKTVTDLAGRWVVNDVADGPIRVVAESPGFRSEARNAIQAAGGGPTRLDLTLSVGSVSESIEVSAGAPAGGGRKNERDLANDRMSSDTTASANVLNLQRRVAGVLPVAVEIPRAGTSFRFARTLVIDDETSVTFSYKLK